MVKILSQATNFIGSSHILISVNRLYKSSVTLSVSGRNDLYQLEIELTAKNEDRKAYVNTLVRHPFNLDCFKCLSCSFHHSVMIKAGRAFVSCDDTTSFIGSHERIVYKTFTEIKISEKTIAWLLVVFCSLFISQKVEK